MNGETTIGLNGVRARGLAGALTAATGVLLLLLLVGGAEPAYAAAYVVDTTSDATLTACTVAAGDCSLRGAITNANASGSGDTITFDTTGSGFTNSITTPDTTFSGYVSVAMDSAGRPVVSYFDATNGDLRILHCGDTNCSSGNTFNSPDTAGSVGLYTSIALDASGYPVVSYQDGSPNFDLKVLHCNDVNCAAGGDSITTPDTGAGANVAEWTSIELDASGFPVVSYQDETGQDLKILHCDDVNCAVGGDSITTPDTSFGGDYSSLELDSSGYPVISYQDSGFGRLDVLHCTNANCSGGQTPVEVDASTLVGEYTSLALDASGKPVVSYYDTNLGNLKVLHCGNADCSPAIRSRRRTRAASWAGTRRWRWLRPAIPVVSYYDRPTAT